jgi:hypothetical protein
VPFQEDSKFELEVLLDIKQSQRDVNKIHGRSGRIGGISREE